MITNHYYDQCYEMIKQDEMNSEQLSVDLVVQQQFDELDLL